MARRRELHALLHRRAVRSLQVLVKDYDLKAAVLTSPKTRVLMPQGIQTTKLLVPTDQKGNLSNPSIDE
jgi:hypothetical protein